MKGLDSVMGDGVTVAACAPGAGHPECGAIPDNQRLIRPGNDERRGPGRRWAKPASVSVQPGGLRWYCVETQAGRERLVVHQAAGLGFEALAPEFLDLVPANPKRRTPAREMLRPAFPRFVVVEFCAVVHEWQRIASLRGVRRIMGQSAERPSPLSPGEAAWIIGQFGPDGAQRRPRLVSRDVPLPVDAWVEVTAGPMRGVRGQVNASDGRAVVLMVGGRRVRMAQAGVALINGERVPVLAGPP